eukprot:s1678_g17.t2
MVLPIPSNITMPFQRCTSPKNLQDDRLVSSYNIYFAKSVLNDPSGQCNFEVAAPFVSVISGWIETTETSPTWAHLPQPSGGVAMGSCACAGFEDSFEQFLECCSASKGVDADAEAVDQNGQISFYLKGRPEALQRPLWLMVASMNAGDEAIHLEGDEWIPRQGRRRAGDGGDGSSCYDLIVVAVQEAILGGPVRLPRVNSNGGELPPRHCNELLAAFLEHLGQDYRVVTLLSRGAMVLLVFAWRFGPPLHDIETAAENTGLAHVFPNKGGLLAKLEVGGTSLCFVAAHLAAHSDHVRRRNADVTEILSGTKVSGMELDAPSYCHHSFFFGDLNYRLDLRPEMRKSPREAQETDELLEDDADVDLILQLIEAGDFQSLLQYDQLHVEMAAGRVLHGFSSAMPTWPPTYRVLKGERGFHFDTKRVPSYCDRVLRRSLPGCQQQLQLRSFHAAPEVCSSDHKPISSTWTFMAAPVFQIPTSPATKGAWLRLSSICCRAVCEEEGPIQLRCRSTPKVMEEVVVENTSKGGGSITWGGITLDLKVSKANLDAVHLLLELWSSSPAFLGVAALHCAVVGGAAAGRFEAPVICYGELRGHLSGFLTDVSPSRPIPVSSVGANGARKVGRWDRDGPDVACAITFAMTGSEELVAQIKAALSQSFGIPPSDVFVSVATQIPGQRRLQADDSDQTDFRIALSLSPGEASRVLAEMAGGVSVFDLKMEITDVAVETRAASVRTLRTGLSDAATGRALSEDSDGSPSSNSSLAWCRRSYRQVTDLNITVTTETALEDFTHLGEVLTLKKVVQIGSITETGPDGDLRVLAQKSFQRGFLKLVTADHGALDPTVSLQAAGLEDGDHLTAIVLEAKLAATATALALFCSGGDRVVTWGSQDCGGDSSEVEDQLKGVQQVQATSGAFAAILADGSVVTWGRPDHGGDSSEVQDQLKSVQQLQATDGAFAAILADGSVVTWGRSHCGGDSSGVEDQLKGVQQVQATSGAFAAILADGSVVTWGSPYEGGDSSEVQDQLAVVQQLQATSFAFAAIVANGSVVTWGYHEFGGDSSEVQDQLKGVQQTFAFAGILADGSVVTLGERDYGGDSSEVQDQLKGVQQVQATSGAFAAILADGSVVAWGSPEHGGNSFDVQDQLKGVQQVQATGRAFAAILADGSVVTWGEQGYGGDSSGVKDQLKGVQQVQATDGAFAAILADGSVVTWGRPDHGGDSSDVQDQLKGVQQLQTTRFAFAAILADGSVVTWGSQDHGGDSSAVIYTASTLVEQSTPVEHLIFDASATVGGNLPERTLHFCWGCSSHV